MLEQLLMNMKVDWVAVAVQTLLQLLGGQEVGFTVEDIDNLLSKYAEKALDFPYALKEKRSGDCPWEFSVWERRANFPPELFYQVGHNIFRCMPQFPSSPEYVLKVLAFLVSICTHRPTALKLSHFSLLLLFRVFFLIQYCLILFHLFNVKPLTTSAVLKLAFNHIFPLNQMRLWGGNVHTLPSS